MTMYVNYDNLNYFFFLEIKFKNKTQTLDSTEMILYTRTFYFQRENDLLFI